MKAERGGTERFREGYQRKINRLPYPHISKEFPGKIDTSTPYVIGKVVSRLEMDLRWALARSVRALVAERDALKEKLEPTQLAMRYFHDACYGPHIAGPKTDVTPKSRHRRHAQ